MSLNDSVRGVVERYGWNRGAGLAYHEHLLATFDPALNEQQDVEQTRVIARIAANRWDTNPAHFLASMEGSQHARMLTHYSLAQLQQMDCFKVPGYNIGFALKDHDGNGVGGSGHHGRTEVVAVHNNSTIRGIGQQLMKAAIANGGTVLDHFDGWLSNFYGGLGFKEYRREAYDPAYDPDGGFAKKYGKQAVIYRRYQA